MGLKIRKEILSFADVVRLQGQDSSVSKKSCRLFDICGGSLCYSTVTVSPSRAAEIGKGSPCGRVNTPSFS